jgi:hypothetical protein
MTKSALSVRCLKALTCLMVLIAATAAPAGAAALNCGALCGQWRLDAAASDPLEAHVDAALQKYREPRDRRLPRGNPENLQIAAEVELRQSLGPIDDRPNRSGLREELLTALRPPETLQISVAGSDVSINGDARGARRYSPGVPHARVDAIGTAKIKATLAPGKFTLNERYDRKQEYTETYTVQRDGSLVVERQIERPGLKSLRLRAVYKPG